MDTVSTMCGKTKAPHSPLVDYCSTVFTLLCLQCDTCFAWVDGLPPMDHLYADGLGVVRGHVGHGLFDLDKVA